MNTLTKGNAWRHKVDLWLQQAGFHTTIRGIGYAGDDITAHKPGLELSVEAKNHRAIRLSEWVDQASTNAPAHSVPVVVAHRRGKAEPDGGYVVLTGRDFARLMTITDRGPT